MAIVEQTIEHKWSCFRRDNSRIKVSNQHLQSAKISRPNARGTLSLDKVWPHTMSTSLNRLKQVMLTTYLAFDDVLQCIKPPQTGYVDVSASGKSRFPQSSASARIHPKSSFIIIVTMPLSSHPPCCLSWSWQITDIIRMDVLASELQSHFICHGLISTQDNQHLHLRVKKGRWGMGRRWARG